jgi:hypothetical protein
MREYGATFHRLDRESLADLIAGRSRKLQLRL